MTEQTPTPLLPYPFCGGQAAIHIDSGRKTFGAGCQRCTTEQIPSWSSERYAREQWNTRATPTAPKADDIAEGLREAVAKIVDPWAFRNHRELYEYCIGQGDSDADARRAADHTRKPDCDKASAKADKIIAALADRATASGEGRCGDDGAGLCAACSLPAHELTQAPGCGGPLPASQPVADVDWPLKARVWHRVSADGGVEKVLEMDGVIDDTHMTTRHVQSALVRDADVPSLPEIYDGLAQVATLTARVGALEGAAGQAADLLEKLAHITRHRTIDPAVPLGVDIVSTAGKLRAALASDPAREAK